MKADKKLIWLDINSSYSHSSLALPAIEACKEGSEYEWKRVSATINSELYPIVCELYAECPNILASTVWLFNHEVVVKLCQRLKTLLPSTLVILGGPEFNGCNEEFLHRNSFVDFVFRGEGEIEFHRFLKGEDLRSIVGLCYIDNNGEYRDNGKAKVADFTNIPSPESSDFFCYTSPFVQLESSRGCFNSCAFCVSGADKPLRSRRIEDMRSRIEDIRKHNIRDVRMLDRTFNYSTARARAMLELFAQYPDMNFHLEIHPALLTDELCEVLRSAPDRLLHIEAGMQSLDDKVIEACGRIGSNGDALNGLSRLCQMDNFETHTDLIAGLPHYTITQIFSDVRTLSALGAGEIQLELLKLLPGTKMRREAEQWGIKYNPAPPYEVLASSAITTSELNRARLLSKLLDRFYNAKSWQGVTQKMINNSSDFLECFLDYLIPTELLEKPIGAAKCGSLLFDFCKSYKEGLYLDDISLAWICNGFSLRAEEAGQISKAATLPDSITRQHSVHYYLWQGQHRSYIICFDRSKEHSHPSMIVEL